ncbi:hypothetical protein [Xanthomonas euvesicatoria]|uniref:hypothetical protein n=1 Tax=Xanthomonas euvesicatoria TaxID=456327 RepID=UPI00057480F3|nr:hypothetical protein [Xanthomonas euvesicatoria]KHL62893.1 hypothetical protein XEU66b_04780 [Xanthomonas euvesicatoria]KLA50764.1 hypothetical protein XEUV685_20100 [Xanthomonas euvesicatoria]KLA53061.1 hypothetical protein XEUV683_11490 [Xanthomonas euvesicatoria]KLA64369.1 hypothetical protein XEUV695_17860 [Xanthomonas euvesicatoria]KLA65530.1 hypothetical protein XEUV689_15545 [Xanthomonas euvesicatoria]
MKTGGTRGDCVANDAALHQIDRRLPSCASRRQPMTSNAEQSPLSVSRDAAQARFYKKLIRQAMQPLRVDAAMAVAPQ